MNIAWLSDVLNALKGWQIKKIVVVFICVYPILATIYFKEELKLMITKTETNVKVQNVADLVKSSNLVKDQMNAASIAIYIYQPAGDKKTSLQRVCYASDERNIFAAVENIDVIAHAEIINAFKTSDVVVITLNSNHELSKLISAYNIKAAYVLAIRNMYGAVEAEAIVTFDRELNQQDISKLNNYMSLIKLSI